MICSSSRAAQKIQNAAAGPRANRRGARGKGGPPAPPWATAAAAVGPGAVRHGARGGGEGRGGGQMSSSINFLNIQGNDLRGNQKNQDSIHVSPYLYLLPKIAMSYGRDTHSGIRFRPKTMNNNKLTKVAYLSKTTQARRLFLKKTKFGIWRLVLNRYDRVLHLRYNIQY